MSQRCDECKHYREANAYVFDREKSYCAKGYDIEYNKAIKYYKEYYTRLFDRGRTVK